MIAKTIPLLTAACFAAASHGGTAPAEFTPQPSGELWTWFAGASAGYVTGVAGPMYAIQLGVDLQHPARSWSQAIYLEAGYTGDDESYHYNPGIPGGVTERAEIDMDLFPITLNYRFENAISDDCKWYAGLGLGVAIVDGSYDWSRSQALPPPAPGNRHGGSDATDARFYGQLSTGLEYALNESISLFGGVRWIFMDEQDQSIGVTGVPDYEKGINNEFLMELGLLFHF